MKRRSFLNSLLSVLPFIAASCTKIYQSSNPAAPTPTPTPQPNSHDVEFRVLGNIPATITASNSIDGMDIINTGLPWTQRFKITKDTFLYLEAKSTFFGTIHVQIFVDSTLFREAVSTESANPFISVSGTFHV